MRHDQSGGLEREQLAYAQVGRISPLEIKKKKRKRLFEKDHTGFGCR